MATLSYDTLELYGKTDATFPIVVEADKTEKPEKQEKQEAQEKPEKSEKQ